MPKIKSANFASFSLDCPEKRKVLDIGTDATGDVASRFVDYTAALNRALVTKTMSSIASSLPSGAMDLLVAYPDAYTCVGSGNGTGGSGASDPDHCLERETRDMGVLQFWTMCQMELGAVQVTI